MINNATSATFTLGTRGSILALTQAHALLKELKSLCPQFNYQTHVIKTQGDQITDKPLWQLEGKDFFTKELDDALINNEVDFVIHSLKDLSSTRPENFDLVTVSQRYFPNDVLFIKNTIVEKIKTKDLQTFTIGTSSPRRSFQLKNQIQSFIPRLSEVPIETKSLRGNVNTRINKLFSEEYDAICLAFAGVERICHNQEQAKVIEPLFHQSQFVLLPVNSFTPSPGQGALAVEISKNNPRYPELKEIFQHINHHESRMTCLQEKKIFSNHGGNCHLALGVFSSINPEDEISSKIYGEIEGKTIQEKTYPTTSTEKSELHEFSVFIGKSEPTGPNSNNFLYDKLIKKEEVSAETINNNNLQTNILFVTSKHCLHLKDRLSNFKGLIISAGESTTKELIKNNIWVHATMNISPLEEFQTFIQSQYVQNLTKGNTSYKILSHALSGHETEQLVCAYENKIREETLSDHDFTESLKKVEYFYWTSFSQYETYSKHFPFIGNKKHFCGMGRTYQRFIQNNFKDVTPCFGLDHFKQQLGLKDN